MKLKLLLVSFLFVLSLEGYSEEIVSYDQLKEGVLEPNGCIICHGARGRATRWAHDEELLKTQIIAGDPDNSPFYIKVFEGSMPLGNFPLLDEDQLNLVRKYIEDLQNESD